MQFQGVIIRDMVHDVVRNIVRNVIRYIVRDRVRTEQLDAASWDDPLEESLKRQ